MKIEVNFKGLVLLALFTALSSFAIAQRTITGLVTDGANNEPLVGASVVVTGTTKGTLTDVDGKYTLTDVDAKATSLTFSFTGYASVTVPIGSSNVIDAQLNGGTILDEMVVVGYGAVRKVDATGAVNSVSEKDFNKGTNTSVEQLLQGRAAGTSADRLGCLRAQWRPDKSRSAQGTGGADFGLRPGARRRAVPRGRSHCRVRSCARHSRHRTARSAPRRGRRR